MAIAIKNRIVLVTLAIVFFSISTCSGERTSYTAAVYEHSVYNSPMEPTTREEALLVADKNLDVLKTQVAKAKLEGADIFVFPEYGITGQMKSRNSAALFSEYYPDPTNTRNCPVTVPHSNNKQTGNEIQYSISSLAQQHGIYIAVNLGDKQLCDIEQDVLCSDGMRLYNTEVVFDPEGCVITKYHKFNLFMYETFIWNTPKVSYSYFDTDFGRFGLMICFDAVFKEPAVTLVEKYNVTDMIFSTAWMNVYPHYVSTAYHSGWARTMNVNYLSSNLKIPDSRFIGSGIYSPSGILAYSFNYKAEGKLIMATVPIKNSQTTHDRLNQSSELIVLDTNSSEQFNSEVFGDNFSFVELVGTQNQATVCQKNVCCHLYFARQNSSQLYALGVFNGMHFDEGSYYLEVCLLVKCLNNSRKLCIGATTIERNFTGTEFTYANLTGVIQTPYAFPEVVDAQHDFTKPWTFSKEATTKTISVVDREILSVVLMGRNFDRDVIESENYSPITSVNNLFLILCFTCYFISVYSMWVFDR